MLGAGVDGLPLTRRSRFFKQYYFTVRKINLSKSVWQKHTEASGHRVDGDGVSTVGK